MLVYQRVHTTQKTPWNVVDPVIWAESVPDSELNPAPEATSVNVFERHKKR